jgi:hypothetical protein
MVTWSSTGAHRSPDRFRRHWHLRKNGPGGIYDGE